ncbi:TPA: hypothetical protein HA278_01140 [Candidatus Woesearchaeota archaeon]|nr:hypothetical protein [Candidatus Woesearchaeota archaeon]
MVKKRDTGKFGVKEYKPKKDWEPLKAIGIAVLAMWALAILIALLIALLVGP